MTVFNFNFESDISNWRTVDDIVMGGQSKGNFIKNDDGNGVFFGAVSLENNGGFSMVKCQVKTLNTQSFSKFCLRLKGDRKNYQFRVKANNSDKHFYIFTFETTSKWETIEIPFQSMYANFRGKKLDLPNFPGLQIEMLAFLIGNKKAQEFSLEIESIVMN